MGLPPAPGPRGDGRWHRLQVAAPTPAAWRRWPDSRRRAGGLLVESVVADEAFWVGEPGRRVLAFLTQQARTKAGESPFQVQRGQRINVSGTVRLLPNDLTPFGVDRAEGADELRRRGHYVEVAALTLS